MELQRRKDWESNKPIPGVILEIKTCISCPDSVGFSLDSDGTLDIKDPMCQWNPTKKISLIHFPIMPHWCPRTELIPDMTTSTINPERFCAKRQAWQNLSREAKMVLNVLFTLPEEFICKNKIIIKTLISKTVREDRDKKEKLVAAEKVYKELKGFTRELFH